MAALDDNLAVASNGAYPAPTPTDAARAIFAASYGLLATAPAYTPSDATEIGLNKLGLASILD